MSDFSEEQINKFNKLLEVFWSTDIPTAYIVGFEMFLNTKIFVNENTLIPRFETEELVINLESKIRAKFPTGKKLKIVDICCGSGVIGVVLFNRLKTDYELEVTFVDICPKALEVTKKNAQENNLNYKIFCGDMTTPLIQNNLKYDVIVSNPPYIDKGEEVQLTVTKYEPHLALYANDNGIQFYKVLINDILKISNNQFCFMLEIGNAQSKTLNNYLEQKHKLNFEIINDMNGFERNLYLED